MKKPTKDESNRALDELGAAQDAYARSHNTPRGVTDRARLDQAEAWTDDITQRNRNSR